MLDYHQKLLSIKQYPKSQNVTQETTPHLNDLAHVGVKIDSTKGRNNDHMKQSNLEMIEDFFDKKQRHNYSLSSPNLGP